VPDSVRQLAQLADIVLSIENEGLEPRLLTPGLNWERWVPHGDNGYNGCADDCKSFSGLKIAGYA
jgi:hypothetical protein